MGSSDLWLGPWPLYPDPRPDAPDSPCALRVGQSVALAVDVDDRPAGTIVAIQDCRAVPGAVRYRVAVPGAPSFWVGEDELDSSGVQGELPLEPSSA